MDRPDVSDYWNRKIETLGLCYTSTESLPSMYVMNLDLAHRRICKVRFCIHTWLINPVPEHRELRLAAGCMV